MWVLGRLAGDMRPRSRGIGPRPTLIVTLCLERRAGDLRRNRCALLPEQPQILQLSSRDIQSVSQTSCLAGRTVVINGPAERRSRQQLSRPTTFEAGGGD